MAPVPPADRRRPLQLELFGRTGTSAPAPVAGRPDRPVAVPAPEPTPADLAKPLLRQLSRLTRGRVQSLVLTDNRRTILSVQLGPGRDSGRLTLRLHRSFVGAPDEVIRAVVVFVESRKGSEPAKDALATLRDHFSRHRPAKPAVRRRIAVETAGIALDLRELRDDLNERYFEGRLKVAITWGKGGPGTVHSCRGQKATKKSTIQLGSYSFEDKLIRIHRALDQPSIPRYVVEAVVYHELLHAAIPPVVKNGRRHVHTPEFRRRERLFRHSTRAENWVAEHLPELLRVRNRK